MYILSWAHFETKTKRYLRGVMVSSCYAELRTVGNLGISLSCFSDSSSLPSNPTVTCCKGHGFGAKPAVVLASRIPYDSTFFFLFFFCYWPNTSSKSNMSEPVSLSMLVVTIFFSPSSGKVGKKGLPLPSSTAGVCPSERVPAVWACWKEKSPVTSPSLACGGYSQ